MYVMDGHENPKQTRLPFCRIRLLLAETGITLGLADKGLGSTPFVMTCMEAHKSLAGVNPKIQLHMQHTKKDTNGMLHTHAANPSDPTW